ncbi:arginine deiminase-related protein [Pseudoxanthomonas suwonensis]|uniref:Amidinotransferase n=1 Tax=Pseudoxanthomonas suwonensis TaxID=314722 RepID=A0A0E3UNG3_9GAMM|nr:arginine deiminase-related protein [Pseudoxanthomonas suwonensis]AKC87146.1 amidinotransferase [Pseudoxanthomonas suwonensis]
MITRDPGAFLALARGCAPDFGPATARAAFLVTPEGFARAEESARDNRYMAAAECYRGDAALAEHRALQQALAADVPVFAFAGDPAAPDAVFPNNVFATARPDARAYPQALPRLVVGRMRHTVRQPEAARADIRGFFREVVGTTEVDLSQQPHPCELTGSLVVDRARGLGYCGLSERCDEAGARLMHEAFGLRATLLFDLAPGEYHANVVLAVLAGRALLASPAGFADPAVAHAIAALYAPHAVLLTPTQQAAFAGNAIALSPRRVWMSGAAAASLDPAQRQALAAAGFELGQVPLAAIEAGGGSLRCCVAEVF